MRHLDHSHHQVLPIAGCPPLLIDYNATAPGIYLLFDPTSLSCTERSFDDSLKIDFAGMTATLDSDGATRLGKPASNKESGDLLPPTYNSPSHSYSICPNVAAGGVLLKAFGWRAHRVMSCSGRPPHPRPFPARLWVASSGALRLSSQAELSG